MLAPEMPFAAMARIVCISPHRVMTICRRYVALALAEADFSDVAALDIDETLRTRGHDYITLAADAVKRCVLSMTNGRDAAAVLCRRPRSLVALLLRCPAVHRAP